MAAWPTGADHSWVSVALPARGTARNASSRVALEELGALTSHTIADAGSVPLEVMTGEPEEYPNTPGELATSRSTGVAAFDPSNFSTRRKSLTPE